MPSKYVLEMESLKLVIYLNDASIFENLFPVSLHHMANISVYSQIHDIADMAET